MNEFRFAKSSHSGPYGSGSCVEVALNVPGVRALRDSKHPNGPYLEVTPHTFAEFLSTVKSGALDHA